LQKYVNIFLRQ